MCNLAEWRAKLRNGFGKGKTMEVSRTHGADARRHLGVCNEGVHGGRALPAGNALVFTRPGEAGVS